MSFHDRPPPFRSPHRYNDGGSPRDMLMRLASWLNASLPIGRYWDIAVRIHITFFLLMLFQVLSQGDPLWTLRWTGLLFISVLLHEFGHCAACRSVGGQANEILMWPLGGLAFCAPPRRPWPEFVTVVCGPLVNVVLAGASLAVLWATFGSNLPVSLNPLHPWMHRPAHWGFALLADLFVVNYSLMLFNLALVFYPFDGGRIVQIALWKWLGYWRSMKIATSVGMAGAAAVAVFGLMNGNTLLLFIAIFGFFTCMQQARQLREAGEHDFMAAYETPDSQPGFFARRAAAKKEKDRLREHAERQRQQANIDRVLDKVHREGLASLTEREKRILQQGTRDSGGR